MKFILISALTVLSLSAFAQNPTGEDGDPLVPNSGPGPMGDEKTIDAHEGAIRLEKGPAVPPDAIDEQFQDHDSFTKNQKDRLMKEKKRKEKKRRKPEKHNH